MGQIVYGVVGAVVGGVAGYFSGGNVVYGAELGFALGSSIGAIANPPKINAPSVPPTLMQRSNYGASLPIGFGAFRTAGTVIWDGGFVAQTSTQGGKGGPQVTSTNYFASWAVSICDCSTTGPISGIRRIWFNGILVYDVSGTASAATITASNRLAAANLAIYLGSATQGVDPTMQAALGVGNVPAYRNTAYIVFTWIPVTNYANTIPNVSFEVVAAGGVGALTQIFETAMSTPTWAGMTYFNTGSGNSPVILGVTPTILVIDRTPGAGTAGASFGDGLVYSYSNTTGAALESSAQTNYSTPFQIWSGRGWNWTGNLQYASGGLSGPALYIMATTDGNHILTDGSHAYLVINSGYPPTGTFVADILASIQASSGFSSSDTAPIAFGCADFAHLLVVTQNVSNIRDKWAIVQVTGGAAVVTAHGTITDQMTQKMFANNASGGSSTVGNWVPDGSTSTTGRGAGCLQSDLKTLWLYGAAGNGGELVVMAISSGVLGLVAGSTGTLPSPHGTAAFPNSSASNTASPCSIWSDNGVCAITSGQELTVWVYGALANLTQTNLGTICNALYQAVSIPAGNIDVSYVSNVGVWGMLIERQTRLRDVMNALAPTFWFDQVESDMKLSPRQRSATPVATINVSDMVVSGQGKSGDSPLHIMRGDDLALPYRVDVGYYNIGADYQVGAQYATRLTTQSTNRQSVNAAAVMTDQDAANAAAVILWDAWAGRNQFDFATGLKWAQVEPTDIVTLVNGSTSYLARIIEKKEQGVSIQWKAVGCAPIYNQNLAPGIIVPTGQVVSSAGATTLLLLDLPPLRDQDGNTGTPYFYVAMYGSDANWPGAVLLKSLDGGATWSQINASTIASIGGTTSTALTDWTGGNFFDECSSVTVAIATPNGTLASASELSVLNGANLCLIGNELLQFKVATLVSAGVYKLTGFLRGRIDTEPAMTGHNSGETFVLLSTSTTAAAPLNIQVDGTTDIGVSRDYEAVTNGQPLGSGVGQFFTAHATNLLPFYPCYCLAVKSGGSGDIALKWTRRNRITWQWLNNVDVPMSEASESYSVSIYNGATVVRTITVAGTGIDTATVTYTAAQQTSDFGAPQTTLKWGVAQVSAIVGAGKQTVQTQVIL